MLPDMPFNEPEPDAARDEVLTAFRAADPDGKRMAAIFRSTFDQLYDGQHTGRYRWDQLFKTEKTHFGTLLEINIRKAFDDVIDEPADSDPLDYKVRGHHVDCKYSQRDGGWMLPPECFGQLLLVATADDARGTWSLGVVRASDANRNTGQNRDAKSTLNGRGRKQIAWLHIAASLPPNILLGLDATTIEAVFAPKSGQKRVNELLTRVTETRIGRNTIATVAQQDDYMARLRDNGHGARTTLRKTGHLIPGGDYEVHRQVARELGAVIPEPGEVVSLRVVPAAEADPWTTELDGQHWRLARKDETCHEPAPKLPSTKQAKPIVPEASDNGRLI
ncbi:hypothetical protein GCM10029976_093050 [Kribbella albertanoniae]